MKALLLLCLVTLGSIADGYRILCIFGIPSKSHQHLGQGIVNALLKGGHEVTLLTPYPPKDPLPKGLSIIDTSHVISIVEHIDMTDKNNENLHFMRLFVTQIFNATTSTPALREALTKEQYDAVVTEYFFNEMDAGYAAVLQVPWILLSTVVLQPLVEDMVDDVKSLGTLPMRFNDFPIPMNFWQRVLNVGIYLILVVEKWWSRSATLVNYEAAFSDIAAARGFPLPPLDEVVHNVSILFVNSHSSFALPQSLPPNVVDIGGYHIEDTVVALPKDMQELLDKSTQGVIYFSMGSIVKSAKFSVEIRKKLLKMFGELPYTVLWKFEDDMKENLPKNVHIKPWMPQAAILAHNNTKVFITHGGLLSLLEAIRYGVPMVAMPVFADQPGNAACAVRAGYALRVEFGSDSMVEDLKIALGEMLANDSYYKQAKYLSFLFNKRPVAPSTLIPHYVEVAIETKGAYHLRSKSKQYWWFQRLLLDQLAALAALLYLLYRIAKKTIRIVISKICGSRNASQKIKRH